MSDAAREFAELKREIVEARTQAIKTDNQVKNLSLDIKGFDLRFHRLESRMRLSGVGLHILVALSMAAAAYVIDAVRVKDYQAKIVSLKTELTHAQATAKAHAETWESQRKEQEKRQRLYAKNKAAALQIIHLIENRQDKKASRILETLDTHPLTPLEQSLGEKFWGDLKRKEAEAAYRTARRAAASNRWEAAAEAWQRSLALEPQGPHAEASAYGLASSLWALKKYEQAEPLLRKLVGRSDATDARISEEARYLLASSLAHLGKRKEAAELFLQIAQGSGRMDRFSAASKAYLKALENNEELPRGPIPLNTPSGKAPKS